ncbi:MAG: tRNA pseudouridine38-40 synthase [Hyphomicrobiaceae bacterium]|jgi:tRNA pseudouridine38-40 synthase
MVGTLPTYLLTIAYDGSRYHGWQQQVGVRTIQEELEKACGRIGCAGVHVEGAGRTDTGVHAFAQGAHLVLPRKFPGDRLQIALNSNLPEDISVRAVRLAPDGFHARFHSRGKRYLYRVVCSRVKPAIGRSYYHWVRQDVDVAAVRQAAQCLVGKHDFASFATNPGYSRSRGTVRTLQRVHVIERRDGFDFVVQGSGFLYNMVRNLVGTLMQVGIGNRAPEWVKEVLEGRDRRLAGATAPARGLFLVRALYARDLSPAGEEPGQEIRDAKLRENTASDSAGDRRIDS